MQSGLVMLCFTLCKLTCVSVNHRCCLTALYKGQAYIEPTFQQLVSKHKEHNSVKIKAQDKKYCKWCKRLLFVFFVHCAGKKKHQLLSRLV